MRVIWHTVQHEQLPRKFEKKTIVSWWREFLTWPMSYVLVLKFQLIKYQQKISLGAVSLWFFSWSFKWMGIVINQQDMGTWCSNTVNVFYGNFKWLGIVITKTNLITWYSDTETVFHEFQNTRHRNNPKIYGHLMQLHCNSPLTSTVPQQPLTKPPYVASPTIGRPRHPAKWGHIWCWSPFCGSSCTFVTNVDAPPPGNIVLFLFPYPSLLSSSFSAMKILQSVVHLVKIGLHTR